MKSKFNFVDLFAGIGGFHQALSSFGGNLVFASEIDKSAIKTYNENYNFNPNIDVKDIKEKDIIKMPKDVHVLTAGFPCQSFSNAGKKEGFNDARGQLIYSVEKLVILMEKYFKKPKIIILENVKHLVNHDNGKTFKTIIKIFENLNYLTIDKPIIISPHQLGIPQYRPRVVIPLLLKTNENKNLKFLKILEQLKNLKPQILQKVNLFLEKKGLNPYLIKDEYILKVFKAWGEFVKKIKRPKNRTLPVVWIKELITPKSSIEHLAKWRQKYLIDMWNLYKNNKVFIDKWINKWNVLSWKKRDQKLEWQAGINNFNFKNSFIQMRQSGVRCRKKELFPTLVALVQTPIIHDNDFQQFRYLTPREAANIQSFPKNFKIINTSDFHSYKHFGNAVNISVIKHVFGKIKSFLI